MLVCLQAKGAYHDRNNRHDPRGSHYLGSLLFCLPTGMAEQPSAATGQVMRPATLRRYAMEAGFREVEILPIEHPRMRLYRLIP
jgi:hypothetical protein